MLRMKSVLSLCVYLSVSIALVNAEACKSDNCDIEDNCQCLSTSSPIETENTPQFVVLSFDDAVQTAYYDEYYSQLFKDRTNNDGSPISATFYVSHQYTNYEVVNNLYNQGFEIASNSISKNYSNEYWLSQTVDGLVDEFQGQREILATFANIPIEQIVGMRIPNLQMNGDVSFSAMVASELSYDNSWPTFRNRLFPYTLDYDSSQECLVSKCPSESYPGFWEAPINDLTNMVGDRCNALLGCNVNGSAEQISEWLQTELHKNYESDRQPFNLLINAVWFLSVENSMEGMKLFLDHVASMQDTYIVSYKQVLEWMKDPEPVGTFVPDNTVEATECEAEVCKLPFGQEIRYVTSCAACPKCYPWVGNPSGENCGEDKV